MNKNQGYFQALNKAFFKKHQRKLLWLLNAPLIKIWFRWILRIRRNIDCKLSDKICEIQPNNYTIYLGMFLNKKGKFEYRFKRDFRTHNKYSKRLYFAFKYVWWTMHIWDEAFGDKFFYPRFSFGFSTLTVYPDAGTGATTVDGVVSRNREDIYPNGESFSTIRTSAGNTVYHSSSSLYIGLFASQTSNQWYDMTRGIYLFDTSSLDDSAVISATVFSIYGNGKNSSFSESVCVVSVNPAANNNLVASDYNIANWGSSEYASRLAISSFSTTDYNDINFNATGIAAVSLTGITKIGCRLSGDLDNSEPSWVSDGSDYIQNQFADTAGTSQDPKLVITYTVPTNYSQTCNEVIVITDSIIKQTFKTFTENVIINDTIELLKIISTILSETITLIDTVTAKITAKVFTETIIITDSIANTIGKVFAEIITLTDTFVKGLTTSRTFTEIITITDSITSQFTVYAKRVGWLLGKKKNTNIKQGERPNQF